MKFGRVPIQDAVGGIAVHGLQVNGTSLRKGETVSAPVAQKFWLAGVRDLVVARLERDDVAENEAARALAEAVCGAHLRVDKAFTGRANLFATAAGVLMVDVAALDSINGVDEAVTLASLPPFRAVEPGEMVATVKIIPFAVPRSALDVSLACAARAPLMVAAYRPLRVGVISTILPGLKDSVVTKTLRVLEARLAPAGASIAVELRIAHDTTTLAGALAREAPRCDVLIVFGASAITDRRDVIPAGVVEAGGTILHFGMPVDPGNLLLLAQLGATPVLGAPGCARSPKENGFDWVLQRMLAGIPVTPADLRRLGAGGLLMEIVSRPQPREGGGPPLATEEDGEA